MRIIQRSHEFGKVLRVVRRKAKIKNIPVLHRTILYEITPHPELGRRAHYGLSDHTPDISCRFSLPLDLKSADLSSVRYPMKTLTIRQIQEVKREAWKQAILVLIALTVMAALALWLFASAP